MAGCYNELYMYHKPSKRKKRAQLTFVYSLMVLAIVSIVAVLVLLMLGYRFNRYAGKVEQGGLVQFDSRPSGADVYLDGIHLANRTASKITTNSGDHLVTMKKTGYTDWEKNVTVKAGNILWLNYARLFPAKPTQEFVASYPSVAGALTSPDRKYVAALPAPSQPVLAVLHLDNDSSVATSVTLKSTDYSPAAVGKTHTFSLVGWDKDSRYLLVRHVYDDTKTEYLSVDSRGSDATKNVTTALGVDVAKIVYSLNNSNVVYILTAAHEIRRGDLSANTLSGPLVSNVADFNTYDSNTLTFETLLDTITKSRSIGYFTIGASKARTVASYTDDGTPAMKLRFGKYYSESYALIAYGNQVTILKGDIPASDATNGPKLDTVATITVDGGAQTLGFSPDKGQFVYAQNGAAVATFDLELLQIARVTLAAAPTKPLEWVDDYHFTSTAGGACNNYDFDGTNKHTVATISLDLPCTIANNSKYFYYFTTSDGIVKVARTKLAIN